MANFQLIKTLTRQKGMTLAQLAEGLEITPAGVTTIITTNSTNTKTIEKIAHILGVRVGVFFDEPEPEETSDPNSVIAQKDAIIAQKDKIIEQKDEVIRVLVKNPHLLKEV